MKVLVWVLVPFPSLPRLALSLFHISLSYLPPFLCIHYPFRGSPLQIQLGVTRIVLSLPSGSGQSSVDGRFRAHSGLEVTPPAQIITYALWPVLAMRHTGVVFLTKKWRYGFKPGEEVPIWHTVSLAALPLTGM